MKALYKMMIGILAVVGGAATLILLIGRSTVDLLAPAGPVAAGELSLMKTMALIMLLTAVPLFSMLIIFAWKYRADNPRLRYEPSPRHRPWQEAVLWIIPTSLALLFSWYIWTSAHQLDPAQPIAAARPPITIQVVALPWKWLFMYPGQNIATVNFVEFPAKTPIRFELTADAPMSAFWIPRLGSQIYAMNGMETRLNLMADAPGDYDGKNTEINGTGYEGMTFTARAVSEDNFQQWVGQVKSSPSTLDATAWYALAAPSRNNPVSLYASVLPHLFNDIMTQFMSPAPGTGTQGAPM